MDTYHTPQDDDNLHQHHDQHQHYHDDDYDSAADDNDPDDNYTNNGTCYHKCCDRGTCDCPFCYVLCPVCDFHHDND